MLKYTKLDTLPPPKAKLHSVDTTTATGSNYVAKKKLDHFGATPKYEKNGWKPTEVSVNAAEKQNLSF